MPLTFFPGNKVDTIISLKKKLRNFEEVTNGNIATLTTEVGRVIRANATMEQQLHAIIARLDALERHNCDLTIDDNTSVVALGAIVELGQDISAITDRVSELANTITRARSEQSTTQAALTDVLGTVQTTVQQLGADVVNLKRDLAQLQRTASTTQSTAKKTTPLIRRDPFIRPPSHTANAQEQLAAMLERNRATLEIMDIKPERNTAVSGQRSVPATPNGPGWQMSTRPQTDMRGKDAYPDGLGHTATHLQTDLHTAETAPDGQGQYGHRLPTDWQTPNGQGTRCRLAQVQQLLARRRADTTSHPPHGDEAESQEPDSPADNEADILYADAAERIQIGDSTADSAMEVSAGYPEILELSQWNYYMNLHDGSKDTTPMNAQPLFDDNVADAWNGLNNDPDGTQDHAPSILNTWPLGETDFADEEWEADMHMLTQRHAVEDTPTFDGSPTHSFSRWLRQFELNMAKGPFDLREDQQLAHLVSLLRGAAKLSYDQLPEPTRQRYQLLVEALNIQFPIRRARKAAEEEYTHCTQQEGESVHDFGIRLAELVTTMMEGDPPEQIADVLRRETIGRMHPHLRRYVRLKEPATAEDAITIARSQELVEEDKKRQRAITGRSKTTTTMVVNADQPTQKLLCFYCGKPGHFANVCRQRQQDRTAQIRTKRPQRVFARNNRHRTPPPRHSRSSSRYQSPNRSRTPPPRSGTPVPRKPAIRFSDANKQDVDIHMLTLVGSKVPRSPRFVQRALPTVLPLLLLAAWIIPVQALVTTDNVFLCPQDAATSYWTLPNKPPCNPPIFRANEAIVGAEWEIFRPNTIEYETTAYHCQCRRLSQTHTRTFFGSDEYSDIVSEPVSTSIAECRRMAHIHLSDHGMLFNASSYFATNNTLEFPDRMFPFYMTIDNSSIVNCYVTETKVYSRHGHDELTTIIRSPIPCFYKHGSCQLQDQGVLIWEPDGTHQCRFIHMTVLKGTFGGNVFIAESQQFALSLRSRTKDVQIADCNRTLLITDQGYAVKELAWARAHTAQYAQHKNRTRLERDAGIVLTNQLAAQLTALQHNADTVARQFFVSALRHICSSLEAIADATVALAAANPTLLARELLNQTALQAKLITASTLEVKSCVALQFQAVTFVQQKSCHNRLPVEFTYYGRKLQAFLDPITRILEPTAMEIDCDESPYVFMDRDGSQLQRYDQGTGNIQFVPKLIELGRFRTIDFPELHLGDHHQVYSNLVLTNLSEIFNFDKFYELSATSMDVDDILRSLEPDRLSMPTRPSDHATARSAQRLAESLVNNGLFAFLTGGAGSIAQVWVFVCCAYVTFNVGARLLFPAMFQELGRFINIPWITGEIVERTQQRRRRRQAPGPPIADINTADATLGSLRSTTKFYVDGIVNGTSARLLVDTGAVLSLIREGFVAKHKIPKSDSPCGYKFIGVGGKVSRDSGLASVEITIGNQIIQAEPLIIERSSRPEFFDVLLGEDILKLLDTVAVQYSTGTCQLGAHTLKLADVYTPIATVATETADPDNDLTPEQRVQLANLLQQHDSIFSKSDSDLGRCTISAPPLVVTDSTPTLRQPYRIPEMAKPSVDTFIHEMLQLGILKESNTPHVAGIVVVPKKNGKLRPCVDFRRLNAVTTPDPFPLPRIDTLLNTTAGHYWYSTLDLKSGFLQIPLDKDTSHYCGVITDKGVFEFTTMPFGLKNAPAVFCRVMATVLRGCESFALAYMDDVIVYTKSPDVREHLAALDTVFTRLRNFGLKIHPEKCSFVQRHVTYVGHRIDENGISPSTAHVEALQKYPPPTTATEVKRFLGMANFFRRFVENFAQTADPLTRLTKKATPFTWSDTEQTAFDTLIKQLTKPPILMPPDFHKEFQLHSDASLDGLAAAILQENKDGDLHAVAYFSRQLNAAEKNYTVTELELLALVAAIQHFRPILYGTKIQWLTDHNPLTHLQQNPSKSARLNRWLLMIQDFDITFRYVKGEDNHIPDALSRAPQRQVYFFGMESEAEDSDSDTDDERRTTMNIMDRIQQAIINEWQDPIDQDLRPYYKVRSDISIKHGRLYKGDRLIPPPEQRQQLITLLHRSHQGIQRTKALARRYVWWPGINQAIENCCAICESCNKFAREVPKQPLTPWPEPSVAMERVHMDFAGPFYNAMWLVVVDAFTRFPFIIEMQRTTAADCIKALEPIFKLFGYPQAIVTDNGRQFAANEFVTYFQQQGTVVIKTPPYHPESNGLAERFVGTFKTAVKKIMDDQGISASAAADIWLTDYRNTPCTRTHSAPSEKMFGRLLLHQLQHFGRSKDPDQAKKDNNTSGSPVWRRDQLSGRWIAATANSQQGRVIRVVADKDDGKQHRVHLDDLRRRREDRPPSSQ